jgi:hypothetical protein
MGRNTFFFLLTLLILSACKPKSAFEVTDDLINDVPDSVLAVEEMVLVMTDIHLAEALVQENKTDTIPQDIRLKEHYAYIFKLHQIDSKKYNSSYNYYSQNPVLMNHIYTKVVEQLNVLESKNLKVKKKISDEQSSK